MAIQLNELGNVPLDLNGPPYKTIELKIPHCFACTKSGGVMVVRHVDLDSYICRGNYVQDVWPQMSPAQRDKIIAWRTGIYMCDSCFGKEV